MPLPSRRDLKLPWGQPVSGVAPHTPGLGAARQGLVLGALVLAVALGQPSQTFGWDVERTANGKPLRFGHTPVSVFLVTEAGGEVSVAGQATAIGKVIEAWNAASGPSPVLRYGGLVTTWPKYAIAVRLDPDFVLKSGGEFLGRVSAELTSSDTLGRVEVRLNAKDFDFSGSVVTASGKVRFDLQVALTHLLGHAMGLGHSRHSLASMFFLPTSLAQRTPTEDDRSGLNLLYGTATPGKACDACAQDADCLQGQCLAWPDGSAYCAAPCASDSDCAIGWSCSDHSGGRSCLPNEAHCRVDSLTGRVGDRCWSDSGCQSGFCQTSGGVGFCTSPCPCSDGASCVSSELGGICLRRGTEVAGSRCLSGAECLSGRCVPASDGGGWCASSCSAGCQFNERCEEGLCIPAVGPGALPVGWPCVTGLDCASATCMEAGGRFARTCSQTCEVATDCPAGSGCGSLKGEPYCLASAQAPYGLGQPCSLPGTCGQGRTCDWDSPVAGLGTCRANCKPFGTTVTCAGGERCVATDAGSGLCRPSPGGLGIPGAACSAALPCRVDLVCAGPNAAQATCRSVCDLGSGEGCAEPETCLPVASAATLGACGGIGEALSAVAAPVVAAANWAAVVLPDLGVVPVAEFGNPSSKTEPDGCMAQATPGHKPVVWLAGLGLVGLLLFVRRTRKPSIG